MEHVRFFDDNTANWWEAETGGANVPALNDLLAPYRIQFAGGAYEGTLRHEENKVKYASGSAIRRFPAGGFIMSARLRDGGARILRQELSKEDVVILGFHQTLGGDPARVHGGGGRIAVFGDSTPFDDSHAVDGSPSWWLFKMLLE
jgi:membrane-bound transcription factor site-1 protease